MFVYLGTNDMEIIPKLLKLRERQMISNKVKSVLYLKRERFYDLFSELQMMTRPAFTMPQVIWNDWVCKIMPMFVNGNDLRVLGYNIKVLSR